MTICKVNKKGKDREIKATSIIETDWRIERFHLIFMHVLLLENLFRYWHVTCFNTCIFVRKLL